MAAPTNLETTVNMVGQREELSNVIHRVAPEKTPVISTIGKGTATSRFSEWQTETLATPNGDNASLEGDSYGTPEAPNRTTRIGNYCQISDKKGGVSRTAEIVDKAGRESEKKRQKILKGIELRRDLELRVCGNYPSQNESGSNPRKTAGLLAFLETNTSRGSGGSDGGFSSGIVSAATDGTQRTFTEALLKGVLASSFDEGAMPSKAFMSSNHKQAASGFVGIADNRMEQSSRKQAAIMAGADVYMSDFGPIDFIPHAYAFGRDVPIIDPEYAELRYLDGYKTSPIGKNADGDQFLMTVEYGLCVKNEKAHANIADLS